MTCAEDLLYFILSFTVGVLQLKYGQQNMQGVSRIFYLFIYLFLEDQQSEDSPKQTDLGEVGEAERPNTKPQCYLTGSNV